MHSGYAIIFTQEKRTRVQWRIYGGDMGGMDFPWSLI